MSNKRSNVRGKDDSARSPDHVARESENAHFAYLRLIGGPFSNLFGNAKTVVDARFKMLNKLRSIWKATRRCPYSPRHLLWGPVLKMASDPNGSDGLHGSRDFIPCESRLQRMMEDGADSESLDPDSEELWANLKTTELSTKDLTTYVMKNCPYPPEMPSLTGANTSAARVCTRSTMLESMDILGEFITDHGEQFKMDVDITHLSIKSETNGIRSEPICVTEHKIICAGRTFYDRTREQSEDFSISQLYHSVRKNEWVERSTFLYSSSMPMVLEMIKIPTELEQMHGAYSRVYKDRLI